jgi:osmotically-inducible protein OsmY
MGSVGNGYEKERAENDAYLVANVKLVKNDLKQEWWGDRHVRQRYPLPTDTELKNAVHDELYQDLRIEDPFEINVAASLGHVTLSGTVESYHDRLLAESDAKDVVGVARVTNNVIVDPANREDLQVKRAVELKLGSDYLLGGGDIQVDVHDGIVNLSGDVKSHFERKHAVIATADVPGVVGVVNALHVSGPVPSDTEIARQIKERLAREEATRWVKDRVRVAVDDGVATLSGDVYTWSERRHACLSALRARGVKAVDNQITVNGVDYPWDEWHTKVTPPTEYEFETYQ